jgi:hypothetical protein
MDFANHHLYELDEESLAKVIARFGQEAGGKPLLSGEWGLTPWFDKSEKGVTVPVGLHNALWIGLLTAGGTPYHWYWDKYFEVGGLAHYRAVAAFLQGEDTVREALRPGVGLARGPVPLSALGMIGPRRAWFWVWDLRSRQTQPQPTPVAGARLSFEGLAAGAYRAEFLDPWTGQALPGRPLTHAGGAANVELPTFTRDLAVKVAS